MDEDYNTKIVNVLTQAYINSLDVFSTDSINGTIQKLNLTQDRKHWLQKELYIGINPNLVSNVLSNLSQEELKIDDELVDTLVDGLVLNERAKKYLAHHKHWNLEIDEKFSQMDLCRKLFPQYIDMCRVAPSGVMEAAMKFMTDKLKNELLYEEHEARSINSEILESIKTLQELLKAGSDPKMHFYLPTLLQNFTSVLNDTKERIEEILKRAPGVMYPGTQGVVVTSNDNYDEQEIVEISRKTASRKHVKKKAISTS